MKDEFYWHEPNPARQTRMANAHGVAFSEKAQNLDKRFEQGKDGS